MLKTELKIISLVPSQTELLVDLGLENAIVGITKFCVHPKNLRKKTTIVGGTKNININKIKALHPTIILCNKEENTKIIVKECLKIAKTHVTDVHTLQDNLDFIKEYGMMFSCENKAAQIINKIEKNKKDFELFTKQKPTLKVAYFIWKSPWMVAANNTFINNLLKLNKFENVFQSVERYPEIDTEKLLEKNLDLVFLSSEPYPFQEKHIALLQKKLPKTNILLVDGECFSWYGSRLIIAFSYFTDLRKRIDKLSV